MTRVRVRKRGKTFSYIFEAGKTLEGKRKVVEKGGFSTKQDAYNAGVDAYNNWKHGNIGITSENIKSLIVLIINLRISAYCCLFFLYFLHLS